MPTEGWAPAAASRSVNAIEVYWAAAVGVEDQARVWIAGSDGVTQGVSDQAGAQVSAIA